MAKRNNSTNKPVTKALPKSPNPQEKKKSRTEDKVQESDPIAPETTENQELADKTATMNLGSKFDKAAAPAYAGGKHIWKNLIMGSTLMWMNTPKELKEELKSFTVDDLFSEDASSIHNLAQKGKKLRGLHSGAHLTAAGWMSLLQEMYAEESDLANSIDGERLRRFGIRLALTDPDTIFVGPVWHLGGLLDRMDTCAWVGAYMLFGAPWKNATSWPLKQRFSATAAAQHSTMQVDDDDDDIAKPPDVQRVTEDDAKPSASPKIVKKVGWTRQLFLNKPMCEKPKATLPAPKKLRKNKRKHMSYMKLKTARLASDTTFEQEQEYIVMLHETFQKLWQIDPDLILYKWDDIHASPLSRTSKLPTNKMSASNYVNGAYLKRGECAWIRMYVGHNKSMDHFEDQTVKDWFRERDMNFYKEKLQAKITCKSGWLLGSNGQCLNPRDLETALGMLPELQGIPIEVRMEAIRTEKGKGTGVKAAHILTHWDKALKCRIAMNLVYGKKSKKGYPLGKNMRFIPNILDTRFIVTEKIKMQVKKTVSKQKFFLQKTQTATSYTIMALDYLDPVLGTTLRELLMGLRSNIDPEKNIFLNVDVHIHNQTVTFLFHDDMAQEAMSAIPALPVILEAKFGTRIWLWFTEEAKEHAVGYYWDKKVGLKSSDDERIGEMLGDWGTEWGSDDDDDDKSTSTSASLVGRMEPFKIVTNATGKNQYYDDGSSVGTFKSTCAKLHQNHDFSDATTVESPASTLTSGDNWEDQIQRKMSADPAFMAYILSIADKTKTDGIPKPSASNAAAPTGGSGDGE